MSNAPMVSVVIPTRNRWSLISRSALPAALGQEGVDVEVVVVDDGSTDATADEATQLARSDPRVRLIRHERPRGVSAARNTGLDAVRGAWVAFLDDDDIWSPRKLAVQLAAGERDRAVFVYAGALAVDATGRPLYEYFFPEPDALARQLLESAVVPAGASNVIVRTDVVRRLGGFDEQFLHLEDWDLWIRLSDAGRAAAVREILVAVLFHAGNKHAVNDQAAELLRLIRKHAADTPPRALDVDRLGHARWVASQHSRAGLNRRAALLYLRAAGRHRSVTDVARAVDALIGKRVGVSATRRRLRATAPVVAPAWLEEWFREQATAQ